MCAVFITSTYLSPRAAADAPASPREELRPDSIRDGVFINADETQSDPWNIWQKWVNLDQLYPEGAFWSDQMNQLLKSMATARITSFGGGDLHHGKQLKIITYLGKQKALFKPMW